MRVLIIDNFDSFTFNLYQYIGEILLSGNKSYFLEPELRVARNNEITLSEIEKYNPSHIILSPGPGSPEERGYFGICGDIIVNLGKEIPILGVCLGMQGIGYFFGARVIKAPVPMHGKISRISHTNAGVFRGIPQKLEVMRYHSLMVEPLSLPDCFEITAWVHDQNDGQQKSGDEIIMGIRHQEFLIEGIQFHPESFATEGSRDILSNFLSQNVHQTSLNEPIVSHY